MKIQGDNHYLEIRSRGKLFVVGPLFIKFRSNKSFAYGISVPAKFGKSVLRNRFKRILREAIRDSEVSEVPAAILISPNLKFEGDFNTLTAHEIKKYFINFLRYIKLYRFN